MFFVSKKYDLSGFHLTTLYNYNSVIGCEAKTMVAV
jgi:hypothetical protein